jgi:sugar phosphate isomerase/epimerase
MKPVMLDLYCGRGGWTKAFLAHGFECHGYDVEDFSVHYPGIFHRLDVLSLAAAELRRRFTDRIVVVCASSPCDEFARFTMPWTRAKNPPEPDLGIQLARRAFDIARELGVPLIFENVRSAQKWLGRAVMFSGPFYLWGDGVPALLPREVRRRPKESFGSKERDKRAEIPFDLADAIARFYVGRAA